MDSTPIDGAVCAGGDSSLLSLAVHALTNIPYKSYFFLFVLFILITSDVVVATILKKFNGATVNDSIAPYGVVIQGIMLVIGYASLNYLIGIDVI